jgi:hypothetical protein
MSLKKFAENYKVRPKQRLPSKRQPPKNHQSP